jgi:hypothetical protein
LEEPALVDRAGGDPPPPHPATASATTTAIDTHRRIRGMVHARRCPRKAQPHPVHTTSVGDTVLADMSISLRRVLPLATVAVCAVAAIPATARAPRPGPLTGTWSGYIAGQSGGQRQHMVIVINARETGGTWKLSNSCQGRLTLDSISSGYHHYLRRVARGATCAGGDIDCLKRAGANLYDSVTSHLGGAWDSSGTLRRVRRS